MGISSTLCYFWFFLEGGIQLEVFTTPGNVWLFQPKIKAKPTHWKMPNTFQSVPNLNCCSNCTVSKISPKPTRPVASNGIADRASTRIFTHTNFLGNTSLTKRALQVSSTSQIIHTRFIESWEWTVKSPHLY